MAQRTRQQRREDLDKAMDIWRARDVYRVQNFFIAVALVFGLGLLMAVASMLKALF